MYFNKEESKIRRKCEESSFIYIVHMYSDLQIILVVNNKKWQIKFFSDATEIFRDDKHNSSR